MRARRGSRARSRGFRGPGAYLQSRPRHSAGDAYRPCRAPDGARAPAAGLRIRNGGRAPLEIPIPLAIWGPCTRGVVEMASVAASGIFKIGGDIAVHRLGYGAMRITGRGIWGDPADRPEAIATLKRLPELGVDFIDTADSYGPDVSEELVREALHP